MIFESDGLFLKENEVDKNFLSEMEAFEGVVVKHKEDGLVIDYDYVSELESYQLEKINLKVSPYRLKIESEDRIAATTFQISFKFLDKHGVSLDCEIINGCVYKIRGEVFIVHREYYKLIETIDQINNAGKNLDTRFSHLDNLKTLLPEDVIHQDGFISDIEFYRVESFGLDIFDEKNFEIAPEIRVENNILIPSSISEGFKKEFSKGRAGQGRKIDNCYVVYSDNIKKCFNLIKRVNQENVSEKRGFFHNPKKYFKNALSNNLDENKIDQILENIFIENKHWKSQRIVCLGEWIPKAGCYLPDRNSEVEWIPKDIVSLPLQDDKEKDYFIHVQPTEMKILIEQMKTKHEKGETHMVFNDQILPINEDSIKRIENSFDSLKKISSDLSTNLSSSEKKEKSMEQKMVPIIRDNIDDLIYEKKKQEPFPFDKKLPCDIPLYKHQEEGVSWLQESFLKRKPGVILADDMGLGKTLQILSFLIWIKMLCKENNNLERRPFLIVAPKALLENWQDEHNKHLKGELGNAFRGYGKNLLKKSRGQIIDYLNSSDWTITTYETLRNKERFFREIHWGVIVFDEAQKIKNPNSFLSDMAKAMSSDFSIASTGTPIENSLIDFWCISDCVYPKKFGLLKDFSRKFCKNNSDLRSLRQEALTGAPPFLIKRWKDDVLTGKDKLPKKEIKIYDDRMGYQISGIQKKAYDAIIEKAQNKQYKNPLEALHELKRYSLFVDERVSEIEFEDQNIKIKIMCKILKTIKEKKEKVLIFTQTKRLQKKLISFLKDKFSMDNDPLLINGETSSEKRKGIVDDFYKRKEGFDILIVSPKAGGVGLTITCANHVIHLERWWNPAVEDQCTDRVYRIGQNKNVFVHIPMAIHPEYKETSFDMSLHKLLENKRKKARDVIVVTELDEQDKGAFVSEVAKCNHMDYEQDCFYQSPEWIVLRKRVFEKYGSQCMNLECNSRENIHVDHIKPRSKYPSRELEFENLQLLCRTCNLKKGDSDSDDWNFLPKNE